MIYHVSVQGNDFSAGTKEAPFRTINRAAAVATPGDTVQVHEGTYREWVDPQNGGLSDGCRILYEAAVKRSANFSQYYDRFGTSEEYKASLNRGSYRSLQEYAINGVKGTKAYLAHPILSKCDGST